MLAPPARHSNLPSPLSAFIGRDREITELLDLISSTRLLTVTGAGGTGKTRLALEMARRLAASNPAHIRWVELAPLVRGDLLIQHIAAQLKVQEQHEGSALDSLVEALQPPVDFLVLDNCEHVIDACAELVDCLLRRCEGLRVLATSREALGIAGERAWLLRGLALEGAGGDAASGMGEAVELFMDRARSVSTSFRPTADDAATISKICRRLDGLPLAIELAAARITLLTPAQIAARLDDAFRLLAAGNRTALPRHRTLGAAVDWSYAPIPPMEQLLLQRLSVFSGPFSLESAESVCSGDGLSTEDVLDLLGRLVARSLVTIQEGSEATRYALLEIIRQYARERLAEDPARQDAVAARHAEHYVRLAETALPHLEKSHSALWVKLLTQEYDNLRAALHWLFERGDRVTGHRLVGALWWYWGQTSQWSEGRFWLDKALQESGSPDSAAWGQVLNGAGSFAYLNREIEHAQSLLIRAADVLESAGDRLHEVMARSSLAHLLCSQNELEHALETGRLAAEKARSLAEPWPLCHAMANGLGQAYVMLGQYDLAEECFREAFEKAERTGGFNWGLAEVTRARASLAVKRNQSEQARTHTLTAIRAAQAILDPHASFRTLLVVQRLFCMLGLYAPAARVRGAITSALAEGMPMLFDEIEHHAKAGDTLCKELGDIGLAAETAEAGAMSLSEALTFAAEQLSVAADTDAARSDQNGSAPSVLYDLAVRCLGPIEVLVQDAPPAQAAFSHTKAGELLVYLLCYPEGRTREQIGLAFWPDAAASQVKNNVHVLLHKLRRALGHNDFVVATVGRYRINSRLRVWFDAAVFEQEVSAALRAPPTHRAERLQFALGLYTGDFLAGQAVGDWTMEIEERLRRRYLDGLSTVADLQIESKMFDTAAETLQRLLETDDLREDAWRRLMLCLGHTGRRDQALVHYQRLAARLQAELQAVPEAATQALAQRLAQSKLDERPDQGSAAATARIRSGSSARPSSRRPRH